MNKYREQRDRYLPKHLKCVFISESPPASGGYFYNPEGNTGEILFRAMMRGLFNDYRPKTKLEGLQKFKDSGYLIVDAIYRPVDKLSDKEADNLIDKNFNLFLADLKDIIKDRKKVNVILIKKNICELLENKLLQRQFKVLNNSEVIPFPMHYHYDKFCYQVRKLLGL